MDYKMRKNTIKTLILLVWGVYATSIWAAKPVKISDKNITKAVIVALSDDDLLDADDIQVSTSKGVVKLKGIVLTEKQLAAAKEDAANVNGVKSVDATGLTLPSTPKAKDDIITAKVKALLLSHGVSAGVTVKTKDGVVYLTGSLSAKRNNKVYGLASQVKGITDVINRISIFAPMFQNGTGG